MSQVTQILTAIDAGDPQAATQLLPLVYDELRKLAGVKLAQEKPGQTLTATALVHEAYLRLVVPGGSRDFANRGHFFAAAAEAMRRILVEQARRRHTAKRGGALDRVDFDEAVVACDQPDDDLLALDEALDRLSQEDPIKAESVKLRYFAGLSVEQAAEAIGISRATADRYWAYAKVWLYAAVRGEKPSAR